MYKRTEADPIVGTLFDGRYLINFLVARGGMGNIYQAHDVRRGHIVALKMLRAEFGNDPVVLRRFQRETEAVSNLHHANICQLYDTGCTTDGVHYFTMEFLEGQALDAILKESHTLPPNVAINYITQVASALCDAHNHGIIHRDLKPANIFIVRAANNEEFAKVLDFGVAKLEEDNQSIREKLTNAGSTLGTPFYMSPEQIQGKEVDGRTDVYALGIILWECLFGTPPYTGNNLIDVFTAAIQKKLPKLPSNLKKDKSWKRIYSVLQKALQKERNSRYDSMQSFLRALEQLNLQNTGAVQGNMSTTGPSIPMISLLQNKSYQLIAIACASLILAGVVGTLVYLLASNSSSSNQEATQVHTYKFYSNPPSEIRINNKIVGNTPLVLDLNDKPPFNIVFINEDDDYNFTVDQFSDDVSGYAVNFSHQPSENPMVTLVTVPPGADVFLNDNPDNQKTPCQLPIPESGTMTVSIKMADYRTETFTIATHGSPIEINTELTQ